jgi:uncharacterized membrane protein
MSERETQAAERRIYRFFEVAILLKGANAVLEIVGGVLALLISPSFVQSITTYFTAAELGQDPDDFIATHLRSLAEQYVAGGHVFIALYLLSHGIVKIILVIGLLKNKMWAYPASLVIFGCFTIYQAYLFSHHPTVAMAGLAVFDLVVMWFIWREWVVVRSHPSHQPIA